MRFSVRHDTLYRYSAPVGLAPHLLRLTPRAERARMLASQLTVQPVPAARRESVDRFGNRITEVSFAGPSDLLRVESSFDLEPHRRRCAIPGCLDCPGHAGRRAYQPTTGPKTAKTRRCKTSRKHWRLKAVGRRCRSSSISARRCFGAFTAISGSKAPLRRRPARLPPAAAPVAI